MKTRLPAAPMLMAIIITAMLSGCGQVAVFGRTIGEKPAKPASKMEPSAPTTAMSSAIAASHIQTVKSVTLALTPSTQAKLKDDQQFNTQALLTAIENELQTRNVLDVDAASNNIATILIEDYTLNPTSNVILFGKIISNATIKGELQLSDTQGNELKKIQIESKVRLSIAASGESINPLEPLYRRFAVITADNLTGTVTKPIESEIQPPR